MLLCLFSLMIISLENERKKEEKFTNKIEKKKKEMSLQITCIQR